MEDNNTSQTSMDMLYASIPEGHVVGLVIGRMEGRNNDIFRTAVKLTWHKAGQGGLGGKATAKEGRGGSGGDGGRLLFDKNVKNANIRIGEAKGEESLTDMFIVRSTSRFSSFQTEEEVWVGKVTTEAMPVRAELRAWRKKKP